MLQQIDISAPEDFNLVSTQNRSNHSRRGGRFSGNIRATPQRRSDLGRCSQLTLKGDEVRFFEHINVPLGVWTRFGQQIRKNEQPLKREGTFEGQMSHIRPQVIVLFNPQSHSGVDALSSRECLIRCKPQSPTLLLLPCLKVKNEVSLCGISIDRFVEIP